MLEIHRIWQNPYSTKKTRKMRSEQKNGNMGFQVIMYEVCVYLIH